MSITAGDGDAESEAAAAYLAVRLEAAGRHASLPLLDPVRPPNPPVAWHRRTDPSAG